MLSVNIFCLLIIEHLKNLLIIILVSILYGIAGRFRMLFFKRLISVSFVVN